MKKLSYLLIAVVFLFVACKNETSESGGEPPNFFYIPAGGTKINLPSYCGGKKAYVIYSNESGEDRYINSDGVNNIYRSAEEMTDSLPSMSIYKGVIDMGNGFVRDEVQFNNLDLSDFNTNSRSAGIYASYNPGLTGELPIGYTKDFWVTSESQDTDSTQKTFTLRANGTHCRIWAYNNNSSVVDVDNAIFNWSSLANAIDNSYIKITAICGSNAYNGGTLQISATSATKLEVLVYDLFHDATSSQTGGVFGYFNPYDFNTNAGITAYNTATGENNPITSNECQNIHIDSFFLKNDFVNNRKIVQSTLVHEFQHLLNFCNKSTNYQTWFTEMLSMSVEELFQTHLGLADNETPKNRFYGNFDKPYNGFYNWPGNNDSNVYYAYANAYAFGAYLMRNYGGVKLIHEIATNPYVNASAITEALHKVGHQNESFNSVLIKFGMVYINTNKSDNSLYKDVNENLNGVDYSLKKIDLSNYYFRTYNSKAALDSDWNNNLYTGENRWGVNENQTSWAIFGPRIFKPGYYMSESIKGYGFAVYYIGIVPNGGGSFRVQNQSNLSMTVVVK